MDKNRRLYELAQKRKRTRWQGYGCIGDYHGGVYECDYVSPYTKSAHNVDSDIMIILQDWTAHDNISGPLDRDALEFGYTPSNFTNIKLISLLKTYFGLGLNDVYATNLFPFIKPGGMNAPIHRRNLILAALEFALPQIKIVGPKIAVCLGKDTFNAIYRGCGHNGWPKLDQAIDSPFKVGRSWIWCQAHTGRLGQNNRNRGGIDRVSSDWKRMKNDMFP